MRHLEENEGFYYLGEWFESAEKLEADPRIYTVVLAEVRMEPQGKCLVPAGRGYRENATVNRNDELKVLSSLSETHGVVCVDVGGKEYYVEPGNYRCWGYK